MKDKKFALKMIVAIVSAILVICLAIAVGSTTIGLNDIISILNHKIFGTQLASFVDLKSVSIVWDIRFPRVLLAFLVGAAISVAGAVAQSVLKNSLASPFTLGVSSGASLGACIVIVFGLNIPFIGAFTLPLAGFVFAVITIVIILKLSQKLDRNFSNNTIILIGMVVSLFFNGLLTVATALAPNTDAMRAVVLWQMGSFAMRGWSYVFMGLPFLVLGVLGVMIYTKELDILTFGEEQAKSVGVRVESVKNKLFLLVAVLSGSAVALSGTIGFLDLIVPHLVRRVYGSNHKRVIPMCIIWGGTMMVITDLLARSLMPWAELPVGAITALLGAPFFAYIYFSRSR